MELIKVKRSTKPGKKWTAIFLKNGREKQTHFGSSGMDDYTITKDKEQRDRYRQRHSKDLKTGDPTRAGYLSYYLLWGDSTSLQMNIEAYKKKFNL
jgi:hypothetical protein